MRATEWEQQNESSRMRATEWEQQNETSRIRMRATEWDQQNESNIMRATEWAQQEESKTRFKPKKTKAENKNKPRNLIHTKIGVRAVREADRSRSSTNLFHHVGVIQIPQPQSSVLLCICAMRLIEKSERNRMNVLSEHLEHTMES